MANDERSARSLAEARDLVKKGWMRGKLHARFNGNDHYCSIGAMREARTTFTAQLELQKTIRVRSDSDIGSWNDTRLSKRQVILAFNRTIFRLETGLDVGPVARWWYRRHEQARVREEARKLSFPAIKVAPFNFVTVPRNDRAEEEELRVLEEEEFRVLEVEGHRG